MTENESFDYLTMRANAHGITTSELISLVPDSCSDCIIETAALVKSMDISHIYPSSLYPELASDVDNLRLEPAAPNRARGAEVMTADEIADADAAVEAAADVIDNTYSYDGTYAFEPFILF